VSARVDALVAQTATIEFRKQRSEPIRMLEVNAYRQIGLMHFFPYGDE